MSYDIRKMIRNFLLIGSSNFIRICLVLIFCVTQSASIQNLAVPEGKDVILECTFNSTHLGWYFIPAESFHERPIYRSRSGLTPQYASRAIVVNNTLTLISVTLSDAGVYGCAAIRRATSRTERAHVIVIAAQIKCFCNHLISQAECSVTYRGDWAPMIEWTQTGWHENYTSDNNHILTMFTTLADTTLICRLYFNNFIGQLEYTFAKNIPRYNESCECPVYSAQETLTNLNDEIVTTEPGYELIAVISATPAAAVLLILGVIVIRKKYSTAVTTPPCSQRIDKRWTPEIDNRRQGEALRCRKNRRYQMSSNAGHAESTKN